MKEYIVMVKNGMEVGYGQEIVRCKDCRHYLQESCLFEPIIGSPGTHEEWFCADAERRETDA